VKIATFRSTYDTVIIGDEKTEKYSPECIRISEWVEVEFPPLTEESRKIQLARIAAARASAEALYKRDMASIDKRAEALRS
jgi:hypothetical protein